MKPSEKMGSDQQLQNMIPQIKPGDLSRLLLRINIVLVIILPSSRAGPWFKTLPKSTAVLPSLFDASLDMWDLSLQHSLDFLSPCTETSGSQCHRPPPPHTISEFDPTVRLLPSACLLLFLSWPLAEGSCPDRSDYDGCLCIPKY